MILTGVPITMYATWCSGSTFMCSRKFSRAQGRQRLLLDTDLDADDWAAIVRSSRRGSKNCAARRFPRTRTRSCGAIGAVFGSVDDQRAITVPAPTRHSGKLGHRRQRPAMVFATCGDTSATGVAFTRNPSTGEKRLYGEFLVNAQGEDVGRRHSHPQEIPRLRARKPAQTNRRLEQAMPAAVCGADADLRPSRRNITATCRTSNSPSSRAS